MPNNETIIFQRDNRTKQASMYACKKTMIKWHKVDVAKHSSSGNGCAMKCNNDTFIRIKDGVSDTND